MTDLARSPTVDETVHRVIEADDQSEQIVRLGLNTSSGLDQLLSVAERLVHDRPDSAERLAIACEGFDQSAGTLPRQARSRYLRARIATEQGEYSRALELLDSARSTWRASGHPFSALRTDLGRMQILDDLGRHHEAADVGTRLLAAIAELSAAGIPAPADGPPVAWLRAAALDNTGVALSFVGEHARALAAYEEAEAVYLSLGMISETARPLANRGTELLALGRAQEALSALEAAAAVLAAEGDRIWQSKLASDTARAHLLLGDIAAAIRVLHPAVALLGELGATAEAIRLKLTLATAYHAAGMLDEAATEAEAVATTAHELGMSHDLGFALLALSRVQAARGDDLNTAAQTLAQATKLFDTVADRQFAAVSQLEHAAIAARCGRADESRSLATAAHAEAIVCGWSVLRVRASLLMFDLDPAGGADCLLDAAACEDVLELPPLRYEYLLRVARLRMQDGGDAGAESALREAVAIATHWGDDLDDPATRVDSRAQMQSAHEALIRFLIARSGPFDVSEACRLADESRAMTLMHLLRAGSGQPARATAPSGTELDRLHADLSATYTAMLSDPAHAWRMAMHRRADALSREIRMIRLRDSVSRPRAPSTVLRPIAQGAPARPTRRVTVLYQVDGVDISVFVVRDGQTTVHQLRGAAAATGELLGILGNDFRHFRLGPEFVARNATVLLETTRATLTALYDLLIRPIGLAAASSVTELLVVPHRHLHAVPFHALHDGEHYLNERLSVTVAPTLDRHQETSIWRGLDAGILAVAVSDERAPAIDLELASLRRSHPDLVVLQDGAATVEAVREAAPGRGVLHVACHGLYRRANPLFSALQLGDRWMTALEFSELDLRGSLVVLSACDSGRVSTHGAEPVGLAWAFLAAGASGVIVSQWQLDDAAAADLTAHLYDRLASGVPPRLALRQAQQSVAAERQHPYYWASFTFVSSTLTGETLTRWS